MEDQPCRKAATYTGRDKHRRNAADIHSLSGIRTHDPSVRASEVISHLRQRSLRSPTECLKDQETEKAAKVNKGL
jgi:hypothetical protein